MGNTGYSNAIEVVNTELCTEYERQSYIEGMKTSTRLVVELMGDVRPWNIADSKNEEDKEKPSVGILWRACVSLRRCLQGTFCIML